jgi:predicted NBD/HSP70 family sugar kinase
VRRYRQLSRAELSRRTRLSEAAVSRIVADLMAEGLLVEHGGEHATGGRPAIRLQLNELCFQAIGVDIQNWETRVSLGTVTGRMIETSRFRTPPSPAKTLDLVAEHVEAITPPPADAPARALGISIRGLVNSDTGVAELGNNPAWVHVEIAQSLAERLGRPVFVENNVRAAALAEYFCGSMELQGIHCLLFVKIDEGIGMGIVLDGKLYRGTRMAAGEFGQMVIAERPGPERHNRPGCLEMLASNDATCQRYRALRGGRAKGSLGDSGDQVKRICHLATEGDEAARRAVVESARYLGIGIANAVWALDAEAVVIDGALTEAWSLVSPAIREQFADGRRFLNFRNLMLRPSALAGEAAIIGAITLPFAPLFSTEEATS